MLDLNTLQRAIQRNFADYFRPFTQLPNAVWFENDSVTFMLPHGAPGNHVLRADFTSDDVEADVAALLRQLAQYTNNVRWLVYDHDQPADLGRRLTAAGLREKIGEPVMLAMLADHPPQRAITGLTIKLVSTEAELRDWQQASGDGFGAGYQFCAIWGDSYLADGLGPDHHFLHFVGYVDGKPVTSSSLLLAGGIAGIYDVSTAPAYRRRGLGRAITLTAMQAAAERGYAHAHLRASDEGIGVYQSLGFQTIFHEREFFWKSPREQIIASD